MIIMKITNIEYSSLLESINCCYAESVFESLPKIEEFPKDIFIENEIDLHLLSNLRVNNYKTGAKQPTQPRFLTPVISIIGLPPTHSPQSSSS